MSVPFFFCSNGTPKRKNSPTFFGSLVLSSSGTNNFGSMDSGLFAPANVKNFQTCQISDLQYFNLFHENVNTLFIKTSGKATLGK